MLLTKKFNNWLIIVIKKTALNSWWSKGPLTTDNKVIGLTNGEYNMRTSTANVNKTLESLSMAISAGKRAGLSISSSMEREFFCVLCLQENINSVINLDEENAETKLNALLTELYAIVPAEQAMEGTH